MHLCLYGSVSCQERLYGTAKWSSVSSVAGHRNSTAVVGKGRGELGVVEPFITDTE